MRTTKKSGYTIFLMEDDASDEMMATRAIRDLPVPCTLRVFRDGAEGLRSLDVHAESDSVAESLPDLILSDYRMPRFNGAEVVRQIRSDARYDAVPVLVYSSADDENDRRRCLACGATAYIAKPLTSEGFIRAVQEAVLMNLPAPFEELS